MKTAIGIDIGRTEIRAAVVNRRGTSAYVKRIIRAELPDGVFTAGKIIRPDRLDDALQKVWHKVRLVSENVVIGFGGTTVLIRPHNVVNIPRDEIKSSLEFDVRDEFPVPVEKVELDYYPLRSIQQDNGDVEIKGLLVAVPKNLIQTIVDTLNRVRIAPYLADINPFAEHRALLSGDHTDGSVALISIGADSTDIVVSVDGRPEFLRVVDDGLISAVAKSVANTPGLNRTASQLTFLDQYNPDEQQVTQHGVDALLRKIQSTIAYYHKQPGAVPVSTVLVSGGGALNPLVRSTFSTALGQMVVFADQIELPFNHAKTLDLRPTRDATAIGLGMRGVA